MSVGGRGGYEFFPGDGNYLFTMTQWYPRLCVYSDFQGWQNHQFTGRGEFALTFGDFKVQMTVPADHLVGSTGECINYSAVLSPTQLSRYNAAKTAAAPVEIQTLAEAKLAETKKSTAKKTWVFNANNVRDFAWTSSRKFIWDAMPQKIQANNNTVMCMSFMEKKPTIFTANFLPVRWHIPLKPILISPFHTLIRLRKVSKLQMEWNIR